MALQRMDNVGIVVESLDAAISFFAELGLELEGRAMTPSKSADAQHALRRGAAPILLVHGLEDGLLPPEQSALMHEALQTVGAISEVEWIEGADHVFFGVDPDPIADRSADFLVRHLAKTRSALPRRFSGFMRTTCAHGRSTVFMALSREQ